MNHNKPIDSLDVSNLMMKEEPRSNCFPFYGIELDEKVGDSHATFDKRLIIIH